MDMNIMSKMSQKLSSDPNINYDILENILKQAIEQFMPCIKVKYNRHKHKKTEWITSGLVKSIKYRDKLYKKLKQTSPNIPIYENLKHNLKIYNKILKQAIRQAKSSFYKSKFDKFKNDSKNTWVTINEIINKKELKTDQTYMNINGVKITENKEIANHFNNYFNRIGKDMAEAIRITDNESFRQYLHSNINSIFRFRSTYQEEIKNIVLNLKSKPSAGYDNISTILLKYLAPILTPVLTIRVNQSLHSGIFPYKLKIAKIIPIFKKNDNYLLENYRPISLLPSISKVFERVVYIQLEHYLRENEYLSNSQYGFRSSHSTEHANVEIVDRISSAVDQGQTPIAIYLDLSKAFDILNPKIMIEKLKYYGVSDSAIAWFASYLSKRPHYVALGNDKSETKINSLGVPQGSILGPLLFIIYVNDLSCSTNFFDFIQYADDTTLINTCTDFQNLNSFAIINEEIDKVCKWLNNNKLSLNATKTKFMIFHNLNKKIAIIPSIKVNDINIERVKDFNFLGITLDQNLNWSSHINKISIKISRAIGIMVRIKRYLPTYILKTLYYSLIFPHLSYGNIIWYTHNSPLFKLQKKAVRIITNSKYNAHSEPLLKVVNFLKLEDIYYMNILKLYFKHCHRELPHYLQVTDFLPKSEMHNYDTRGKNAIHVIRTRTKILENYLRYKIPTVVNMTPPCILQKINTHSYQGFSLYIKNFVTNSYNFVCSVTDCYVCKQ